MGIVLYETLTGKLPILGKTMVDTMSKHCSETPPSFKVSRPDLYIPERLEAIIFKALAKDPADRQQTMDELKSDLESAIPRAGRTATLRAGNPQTSYDLSTIVLSKNSHNPFSSAKYSLLLMGLGALLTFLIAFTAFKVMTLNTVKNNQQATATTGTTTNTIPATGVDSTASVKSDVHETDESSVPKNASSDIQKLVNPVRHKLGTVQPGTAPETVHEPAGSKPVIEQTVKATEPVKKVVSKPAETAEVHKPKRPRHVTEKNPWEGVRAQVSKPAPHPTAPKASKSPWDTLRSQLNN